MARRQETKTRQRIAQYAAKLMAEDGITSYMAAKKKAAQQLGAMNIRKLPDNSEIEAALAQYQRLFQGRTQQEYLSRLRQTALEAMKWLTQFNPRLVGSVLSGTASKHSVVSLHVFTDTPEDVCRQLLEFGVPFESGERRLRIDARFIVSYPAYRFMAEDVRLEVVVLPLKAIRQAPLSPVDGKPMQRADQGVVESLLNDCAALSPNRGL